MHLFQDRHAPDNIAPVMDESQDFDVVGGYENGTHTVIRFKRKWETCDQAQASTNKAVAV